jgi:hypothetical protein
MDAIDFTSTTEFTSAKYPGVRIKIRKPTIGARMAIQRRIDEAQGDLEWRQAIRALWNELLADYNVTIDGKKPGIEEFFLNGDEQLVDEICSELLRISRPLGTDEDSDQRLIEDCRRQIREAEERIARRKNSAPQSSGPTPGAGTRTAGSAGSTRPKPGESEPSVTAAEIRASNGPSIVSDASGDPGATA